MSGLSRRRFLGLGLTGLASIGGLALWQWLRPGTSPQPRLDGSAVLRAYIDTLIPAANGLAGGLTTGTDRHLIELAGERSQTARILKSGTIWLERRARREGSGFAEAPPARRERIVAEAAAAALRSLPRAFFELTRHHAFGHHYAQPAAWQGLPYGGAPQPAGFPHPDRPPRHHERRL